MAYIHLAKEKKYYNDYTIPSIDIAV